MNKSLPGAINDQTARLHAPQADLHSFAHLALSPAGDRLVCVETGESQAIVVRDRADGKVLTTYDPHPGCIYRDPTFAPDGRAVAVLAVDERAHSTALWLDCEGRMRPRGSVVGAAERLRYSPTGDMLALVSRVDEHGADTAPVVEVGAVTAMQQLLVIRVEGDTDATAVSPHGRYVYDFDWTPDGQGLVAIVADGDGDNGWYTADIRHYDRDGGRERVIARPGMQIASARVSNDGRSVAFIGGLMSDFSWPGGDIFVVPLAGGEPVCLTSQFVGSFTSLHWRGHRLIATALTGDVTALVVVDPLTGEVSRLGDAAMTISAGRERVALDAAGSGVAGVMQDYQHAPEIVVGGADRFGRTLATTRENARLASSCSVESVVWNNEGYSLQGWLLSPRQITHGHRHPLVMMIHGGPAHAFTPIFPSESFHEGALRRLLQAGYFVFMPNPRGSYGKGADFARANQRDFGGGDFRDLMSGLDVVLARAPIDPARLGVMGHSYGGFLTMWTVTQTRRFKAAVAGGGIANWTSYFGQTSIEQWMAPFFGAPPYDDACLYEAMSPIRHVKQVTTPTLLYVGNRDFICPPAQSMEFWRALNVRGVETSLRIFPDEGHEFCQPRHIGLLADLQFSWLDRFLQSTSP